MKKAQTKLYYTIIPANLSNSNLEALARQAQGIAGGQRQVPGFVSNAQIITSIEGVLVPYFKVIISTSSRTDLEIALSAFMSQAGSPHLVKGAYDSVQKVLRRPEFNKTLKGNPIYFLVGKEIVDIR